MFERRMWPRGTDTSKIPADARGIVINDFDEWIAILFVEWSRDVERMRALEKKRNPKKKPWIETQPIHTGRDDYGMKGVNSGARTLFQGELIDA